MRRDFPPEIGPLSPTEIEIIDATEPSLALSDDTPLLTALEAILLHRCNDDERKYYEALSPEEKTRSSIRFAIRFR
jgi:hypothetical protein